MVEASTGHHHIVDFEVGSVVKLAEGHVGARLVKGNREEWGIDLQGEHAAQVLVVALASVHEELVAGAVEWREERQALDVVPVGVADKEVGRSLA